MFGIGIKVFRFTKGVKPCPHCGGQAYFGIYSGGVYAVQCDECHSCGPRVELPTYYSKGFNRLWSRLYARAVIPWNKRKTGPTQYDTMETMKPQNRKLP
jgi:hypothetical protein